MGNVVHVHGRDWEAIQKSSKLTLLDFWADWCGPCHMLAPTFDRLAAAYGDKIDFAKINVDEMPDIAGQYGIRSIPTLLLVSNGQVIERLVGVQPYETIAAVLDRHTNVSAQN
jgi:thioredoxin 1